MVSQNYATTIDKHSASAYGSALAISTKSSINICKALRGLPADKAVRYLDAVIAKKRAIPFTRFTDGVGHRTGAMAAGRYPIKAAEAIKALIVSAQNNAENKGLSNELKIVHINADKASTPMHQGRQRRRSMKRTHIQVVLKEMEGKAKQKNQAKKVEVKPKTEAPVAKKAEAVSSPEDKK